MPIPLSARLYSITSYSGHSPSPNLEGDCSCAHPAEDDSDEETVCSPSERDRSGISSENSSERFIRTNIQCHESTTAGPPTTRFNVASQPSPLVADEQTPLLLYHSVGSWTHNAELNDSDSLSWMEEVKAIAHNASFACL